METEEVAAVEEKTVEPVTVGGDAFAMPSLPVVKPKTPSSVAKTETSKPIISVTEPSLNYSVPSWACEPKNSIKYSLEFIRNGCLVEQRPLKKMKNSTFYMLGRLPANDLMLNGKYVSRHHCILQYGQSSTSTRPGWHLYDLKTTHGTRVNRRKVVGGEYIPLQSGFYISFGVQDQEACVLNYEDPEEVAEEEAKAAKLEMKDFSDLAEKRKQGKLEKKTEEEESTADESEGISWGMDYADERNNGQMIELESHLTEDAEAYYNTDPKKALAKFFDREGFEMKFEFSESGQGHNHKWICSIELPIEVGGIDRTYTAQATVSTSKKDGIVQCALEACKILDKHGILRKSSSSVRLKKKTLADNDYFDEDDDVFFDRTGQLEKQRDKRMRWATMGNKAEEKRITYADVLEELEVVRTERDEFRRKIEKIEQSMMDKADVTDSGDQDSLDAYCSQLKKGGISNDINSKTMVREMRQQLVALVQKCSTLERQALVLKPVELPALKPAAAKSQDFLRRAMMIGRGKKVDPPTEVKKTEDSSDKSEHSKPIVPRSDFVPEDDEEEATTSKTEENESPMDAHNKDADVPESSNAIDLQAIQPVESPVDTSLTSSAPELEKKQTQAAIKRPITEVIAKWEAELDAEATERQKKEIDRLKEDRQKSSNPASKKKLRQQKEVQCEEYGTGCEERDLRYATWVPPENQSGDGKTKLHEKFADDVQELLPGYYISMTTEDLLEKVFDVVHPVLDGSSKPEDAFAQIKEMRDSNSVIGSILLDVLITVEVEAKHSEGKKKRFLNFVEKCCDTVIPRDILCMDVESFTPDDALRLNRQQLVRVKTKLYFKQSKFNLLWEESEGYSKLITELLDNGGQSPKSVMTKILCLIGQFNLDPNRVTDVVLDCFEMCLQEKKFFLGLLVEIQISRERLCTTLGFKYTFYHQEGKVTPISLYQVTAALLEADMIDLLQITPFMRPDAEGIKTTHKERVKNSEIRAKKGETIMASQIPVDSRLNGNGDSYGNDSASSVTTISFATVAMIQETDDEKNAGNFNEAHFLGVNQKLGLAVALAEIGVWNIAKLLIDRLPEYYAVQASPQLCCSLADMADAAFDKFYKEQCSRVLEECPSTSKEKKIPDGITEVRSWCDLAELSNFLWYLGPRLSYRQRTATKLVRLIAKYWQEIKEGTEADEAVTIQLMNIVDEVLVPGTSLISSTSNAAYTEELWSLLQMFPYQWRYRLYGNWKLVHTVRHPELNVVRGKILGRTRYVIKRLSKETVKVMGRQLGKLCHISPITVFDYLLAQVQTFDNFIQPVVESFKFLTSMEFDVLSYCLIDQLANPDKQQLKASDGSLSPWLQALATLVGSVYKKYNIELGGILNYVANQLKQEKSYDLTILREIIQSMSSIESTVGATQDQLDALQGGEVLRLEAGGFSNVRNRRVANRLRDALLEGDLAVGLAILIAQQRECIVHKDSSELPLKMVGEMIDQCRDTLMQFISFLLANMKQEDYQKRIPTAAELMGEYHMSLPDAMYFTRSTYMPKVVSAYYDSKQSQKLLEADGKNKLDKSMKFLFFKSAMDDVVTTVIEHLKPHIPAYVCSDIPVKLVVVFWMLNLYDIEVPTAAYDKASEAIKKQTRDISDNADMSKSKRVKEEERLKALEGKLREEQRKQIEHVERVRSWLQHTKDTLFEQGRGQQTYGFLQMCILPRVLYSELDAIYSARLVMILHTQRTTFFQTLIFIDKTFNDILPILSGLSENEAASLGVFMEMILAQVQRWHSDNPAFSKECDGTPGFLNKTTKEEFINYGAYQALCLKWQTRLYRAFTPVLKDEKSDYALIRNTLVIMTKIVTSFPIVKDMHSDVEAIVMKLRDREKGTRDDLSLKAASYAGRLKMSGAKIWEKAQFAPQRSKPTAAKEPAPAASAVKKAASSNDNASDKEKVKEKKRTSDVAAPGPEAKRRPKTVRNELNPEPVEESEKSDVAKTTAKSNGSPKKNIATGNSQKAENKSVSKKEDNKVKTKEKQADDREDGEVAPSPPPKKPRIAGTEKEENGKEVDARRKEAKPEEQDKRNSASKQKEREKRHIRMEDKEKENVKEKETKEASASREVKDDNRRNKEKERDRDIPSNVAGPELPPPAPKRDRAEKESVDEKRRESRDSKVLKRSGSERDKDEKEPKVAKKEREGERSSPNVVRNKRDDGRSSLETRLMRPSSKEAVRRSASPRKDDRDKERNRREDKDRKIVSTRDSARNGRR